MKLNGRGFVLALCVVSSLFAVRGANAQARSVGAYVNPPQPAWLAPPDLPDVPECRGILSQSILDAVNAAKEDPAETFEKHRRANPHMIMLSPPQECASKLWRVVNRDPRLENFVASAAVEGRQ